MFVEIQRAWWQQNAPGSIEEEQPPHCTKDTPILQRVQMSHQQPPPKTNAQAGVYMASPIPERHQREGTTHRHIVVEEGVQRASGI
jgi:hypothetical protein